LDIEDGGKIELDRVLMVADGENITTGAPVIEGAKVLATVVESGKGDKVIVFKYKPKVRYRRKNGHRQLYTRLTIDGITAPGIAEAEPKEKPKPKARAKAKPKAAVEEKTEAKEAEVKAEPKAAVEEKAEANEAKKAEETAKPKAAARPRRKKKEETADGA
jgi:large subunit ribosomal protein L21